MLSAAQPSLAMCHGVGAGPSGMEEQEPGQGWGQLGKHLHQKDFNSGWEREAVLQVKEQQQRASREDFEGSGEVPGMSRAMYLAGEGVDLGVREA